MKRTRFVQPQVVRIQLSDNDWIDVKKQLSVGEEREAFQQVVGEINTTTGWRKPNVAMLGIAEMLAYIVEWSFVDAQDRRVPVSADTIKQLDQASFKEVETAMELHIKAMEQERTAEKNGTAGEIASVPISPSAA